ncbi:MAG: chorismate lyase [Methylovulum sp.]|jgi:chorismate--pyruvate lyase|nr:chorismate lyase [Methylovulum sp.]
MKSKLFRLSPRWQENRLGTRHRIPKAVQTWIYESGSLTQRLRQEFGQDLAVKVLWQANGKPLLTENRVLQHSSAELAWIREVQLHHQGRPLLLARTIMPRRTLAIAHGQLTKLGNRPLGEIIFAYAHVARQALDVSYVMPNVWQPDIALLAHHAPVWGRRTVYIIEQQPLLVSEFFMPDLFTSGVTTHD